MLVGSYDPVSKANVPVNVTVSFVINDILKIEEIDHIYLLKEWLIDLIIHNRLGESFSVGFKAAGGERAVVYLIQWQVDKTHRHLYKFRFYAAKNKMRVLKSIRY